MENAKKIAVFALEDAKPSMAYAVYNGRTLAVTHYKTIPKKPGWQDELRATMKAKADDGAVVMAEDPLGMFADVSTSFAFEDIYDGRTMLQQCLESYFALTFAGYLILAQEAQGLAMHCAEGGIIDKSQDEKGRSRYTVDWRRFHGGHKALLMCVAGALMESQLSERWLLEMGASRILNEPSELPFSPFGAITIGHDKALMAEFEKSALELEAQKQTGVTSWRS